MDIEHRKVGDVTIIHLTPEVVAEVSHDLFLLMIDTLLDQGHTQMVVDVSSLRWINSMGLGLLVGAHRKVDEQNGQIVIAGPNQRIQDLMRVVGMLQVWKVYETVDEAVASIDGSKGQTSEDEAGA